MSKLSRSCAVNPTRWMRGPLGSRQARGSLSRPQKKGAGPTTVQPKLDSNCVGGSSPASSPAVGALGCRLVGPVLLLGSALPVLPAVLALLVRRSLWGSWPFWFFLVCFKVSVRTCHLQSAGATFQPTGGATRLDCCTCQTVGTNPRTCACRYPTDTPPTTTTLGVTIVCWRKVFLSGSLLLRFLSATLKTLLTDAQIYPNLQLYAGASLGKRVFGLVVVVHGLLLCWWIISGMLEQLVWYSGEGQHGTCGDEFTAAGTSTTKLSFQDEICFQNSVAVLDACHIPDTRCKVAGNSCVKPTPCLSLSSSPLH